jgi:hypothetical protein
MELDTSVGISKADIVCAQAKAIPLPNGDVNEVANQLSVLDLQGYTSVALVLLNHDGKLGDCLTKQVYYRYINYNARVLNYFRDWLT